MAMLPGDLKPLSHVIDASRVADTPIKDIEGVAHTLMLLGTLINQKVAGTSLAVTAKPSENGGVLFRKSASLMLPNQRSQDGAIEFAVKKLGFIFKRNYNHEFEISCPKEILALPVGDQYDSQFAKQFNALYQQGLAIDSKSAKRSLRHRSNPLPGGAGMAALKVPKERDRSASDSSSKRPGKALTPVLGPGRKLDQERKSRQEELESLAISADSGAKTFLKLYQASKDKDRDLDKEQSGLLKALDHMKLQEKEKVKQTLKDDGRPVVAEDRPVVSEDVVNENMVQLSF